jgi:hypothetical protein
METDKMEQVAYLMADVGNVQSNEIKDIYENLEALSCKSIHISTIHPAISFDIDLNRT